MKKMKSLDSIKVANYKMENHIITLKLEGLLINGMRNMVSFVCYQSKTCIGEFACDGRVDRIEASKDKKEIFIYTDKCKFYRIQMN